MGTVTKLTQRKTSYEESMIKKSLAFIKPYIERVKQAQDCGDIDKTKSEIDRLLRVLG